MAVTPEGAPAWTRTVSYVHYGGHASKENYLGRGAIDPLTDVAAEEFSRMVSDVAAVARTAAFAVMVILTNDTSPAAPTVEFVYMMTGISSLSYAGDSPPTGFPSVARNGDGDFTVTFASSYTDEYGVSGAYAPRHATACPMGTSSRILTTDVSGQTVRVRVFSDAGAAVQDARVTLEVV